MQVPCFQKVLSGNAVGGRAGLLRARGRSGGWHCTAGQSCYVPLGRHLVYFQLAWPRRVSEVRRQCSGFTFGLHIFRSLWPTKYIYQRLLCETVVCRATRTCSKRVDGIGREGCARRAADVCWSVWVGRDGAAASPARPSSPRSARRCSVDRWRPAPWQILHPQLLNPLSEVRGNLPVL